MIGLVFSFFGALLLLFLVLSVGGAVLIAMVDSEYGWVWVSCGVILLLKLFGVF